MTAGLARKLNRTKPHREALLKNLVSQLLQHGTITSTHEKCKEASRLAERVITWAKKVNENPASPLASQIQSKLFLSGDNSKLMKRLVTEIAPRYAGRNGGYTRVLHLEPRLGDRARQSILELVGTPVQDSQGNLQRGNIKLWIIVKNILNDEKNGVPHKPITLHNLRKMLLGKTEEQVCLEVLTIRKFLKENEQLEWHEAVEMEKVTQLMKQLSSSTGMETSQKKKRGYVLISQRPAGTTHIAS